MSNEQNTLSPAHIEDGEEVEVVGYSIEGRDEIGVVRIRKLADRPFPEHMQDPRDWAGPFNVVSEPLMTVAQHQRIVAARASKAAARVEDERDVLLRDMVDYFTEAGLPEDLLERYRSVELAALSAPPAAGVPEGWKLVPMEPTAEMVQAALDKPAFDALGDLLPWSHITRTSYAAMLDASPTPPASEQQRAVVMPERKPYPDPDGCPSNPEWWARQHEEAKGWNDALDELLRLNPHLAKGEGV